MTCDAENTAVRVFFAKSSKNVFLLDDEAFRAGSTCLQCSALFFHKRGTPSAAMQDKAAGAYYLCGRNAMPPKRKKPADEDDDAAGSSAKPSKLGSKRASGTSWSRHVRAL
jgi:hypothetical protein